MNSILLGFKRQASALLTVICPDALERLRYRRTYHSHCNLKNPHTFSEKLLWLKKNIYWDNPLIQTVGDKYRVRDYLQSLGHGDILNELYCVCDSIEEIDWNGLPKQFVIKLSVGCGTNLICSDKSKLDVGAVKAQLTKWMHPSYFSGRSRFVGAPHKERIVCEKYLGTESGAPPCDYKFYCFNGKPQAILVIDDRFSDNKTAVFMSLDWKLVADMGEIQPSKYHKTEHLPSCPKCLRQMIEVAHSLSTPFPFIRIDLYEVDGRIYFGEFTMCPHGCIGVAEAAIDGQSMGELLDISYLLQGEEH